VNNDKPEAQMLPVLIDNQLLLFEDDYGKRGPQCVAQAHRKKRCTNPAPPDHAGHHGFTRYLVRELGGYVTPIETHPPYFDHYIKQRCEKHLYSSDPDAVAPTWELFDVDRHKGRIPLERASVWTPTGVQRMWLDGRTGTDTATAAERGSDIAEVLSRALEQRRDPEVTTKLYTAHDKDGRLLYIGISDKMGDRLQSHVEGSSWMEFAANISIDEFPTRRGAEQAERERVKDGKPLFNVVHNDHPSRDVDLIQYLIEKGRTDLLALNVSRG